MSSSIARELTFTEELRGHDLTFTTTWGLFSPERVDNGSHLLIDQVELAPKARILDLGCGYGALGLALAAAEPTVQVEMVDKDFVAVEYAQKNARDNHLSNVSTHLSNGFDQVEMPQLDVIVSNLPAKVSSELFEIWFSEAHERLLPGGQFYVVTISGLREYIKRRFQQDFGNYEKLAQGKTYTVGRTTKQ